MDTAYLTVAVVAVAANAFSGIGALVRLKAILPAMARANVPVAWLTFRSAPSRPRARPA